MYLYDEFQTERAAGSRRPPIESLHDVFLAIAGDEAEHVATMAACQDRDVLVRSANLEAALAASTGAALIADRALQGLAALDEAPEGLDALVDTARLYVDSGGLDAAVEIILKFFPFIGG